MWTFDVLLLHRFLQEFTPAGDWVRQIPKAGAQFGGSLRGVNYQYFVGVDAQGDLIAVTTDGRENKVMLFHAKSGEYIRSFGEKGTEPGLLGQAMSVRCACIPVTTGLFCRRHCY